MASPSTTSSTSTAGEHQRIHSKQMKRNQAFIREREPFRNTPELQIRHSKATGPFTFLNPTSVHFRLRPSDARAPAQPSALVSKAAGQATEETPGVNYKWTARNNRKGRHALSVDPNVTVTKSELPRPSSSFQEISRGIVRMFTYYPIWDVSYLVATVFTLGSVVWVINAFFAFLPLVQPSTEFSGETLYGGGISAFIGATIFEFGSFLLMAEAVNENRTGCFGWAVEQLETDLREKRSIGYHLCPSYSNCTHHHVNKHNLVGKPTGQLKTELPVVSATTPETGSEAKSWVWWPSWYELRTHYFHELGFLACLSQLFGATIFWISGFTALPGIYNHMSHGLTDGIYWTPQVIGGSGFIVSGTLFMIETQTKWYIPAPKVLGWHIGLWNLIGGVGFTLCPAFGYDTASWAQYQASLSTFWGSWAFLIGSVIQWYESLDKHPVVTEDLGSGT